MAQFVLGRLRRPVSPRVGSQDGAHVNQAALPIPSLHRPKDSPAPGMSSVLRYVPMQQTGGSTLSAPKSATDTTFVCSNCSATFVVNSAAAGMTVNCQKCGHPNTVPHPHPRSGHGKLDQGPRSTKPTQRERIPAHGNNWLYQPAQYPAPPLAAPSSNLEATPGKT